MWKRFVENDNRNYVTQHRLLHQIGFGHPNNNKQ